MAQNGAHNHNDVYSYFSREQIEEFHRAYETTSALHTSRPMINGTNLTIADLGTLMRAVGLSPDEIELQDFCEELGINHKTSLDFPLFMLVMTKKFSDYQIRQVFRVFDQDGDGVINIQELKHMMDRLGETLSDGDLLAMLREADIDSDMLINYDDFSKIMRAP